MKSSAHTCRQFDSSIFESISIDTFDPEYWQSVNAITGQELGRGTTWFLQHNEYDLVLRHYRRGGLVAKINQDSYWWAGCSRARSIHEFNVLSQLVKLGLPVPKPAAAQAIRTGLSYKADIIIEKIPNASDLVSFLQQPQSESFFAELGRMVAKFHQAEVYHADLNIKNVMIDNSGKLWLIDFDRAQLNCQSTAKQTSSLNRLKRSFEKERVRHKVCYRDTDWDALASAYQEELSPR